MGSMQKAMNILVSHKESDILSILDEVLVREALQICKSLGFANEAEAGLDG